MRRRLLRTAAALVLLWSAGFAWFVHAATGGTAWPRNADGIVVLTGGALRIETALALLDAGVADRLLISGVPQGVALASIVARLPDRAEDADDAGDPRRDGRVPTGLVREAGAWERLDPGRAALAWPGRVTLGHGAGSTIGNAIETAGWARRHGLHSLVVVTAGYHMQRALAEIAQALPGVTLVPYQVQPPGVGIRILAAEYMKFLAVAAGIAPSPAPFGTV